MPEADKTYRIFISAAEPSADAHCAALITALKQSSYSIDFVGVGGPKMAAAGCHLLETTVARAAMIYNAFAQAGFFYKLIKRITRYLQSNNVDLVIVCDSPAFNFHIAKAAKKAGLKTLFYVAPQLWSWAGWRIRKMKKYCDKLCCILPFEQDWFSQRGIDTTFVGNPILDELSPPLTLYRKKYLDFNAENAHFAILPGSRAAEINTLWVPMQQIAIRLKQKYPNAAFTTVAVDADRQKTLKNAQIPGFQCKYAIGSVCETARNADFAIVTSGSATLQVAAVGCPMVIMYQSSKTLWHLLGRWLLTTKYLSLVNILANKELVPEFMPYFSSIKPVLATIELLLEDSDKLAQTSDALIHLAEPLVQKKACSEVARIAVEMLS
ncbi:MAG: lipid-A-disaccharide synthase [Phycisphaerae bacterium]|nr:lipid-A-disaccharide synthase [Phycisphaerae bacterium]MDD5380565.1 lipid-A-disaccharide synthase [Phycisphaerae bacterium]